jgi:hypothetical protein
VRIRFHGDDLKKDSQEAILFICNKTRNTTVDVPASLKRISDHLHVEGEFPDGNCTQRSGTGSSGTPSRRWNEKTPENISVEHYETPN